MRNLTKEDLIKIHEDLVKVSSEEEDILSEYKLNLIVNRHQKSRTIVKKGAVLLHHISYLQPFSEGNKRTAFSSLKVFIELNKKLLRATNKELENIILKGVNNNIKLRDVEKWLKKRILIKNQ